MNFDIRPCSMLDVFRLCKEHHGYGGAGKVAVYAWGVYEEDIMVAAYAWQPPPPGAAKAVCPEAPGGVLALSRMVAVPRERRRLKHVSKPLRVQMKNLIDRGRWPVLVTYSDRGQGHTGYVYQCSGWSKTATSERVTLTDAAGTRVSSYSAGAHVTRLGCAKGRTTLDRWESWACDRGMADAWMRECGWILVPVPGRSWKSGNPAYTWVQMPARTRAVNSLKK